MGRGEFERWGFCLIGSKIQIWFDGRFRMLNVIFLFDEWSSVPVLDVTHGGAY